MSKGVTRRRALTVLAAAAIAPRRSFASSDAPITRWRGHAFGAAVTLSIRDPDLPRARAALQGCATEISGLEDALSLYRGHSALSRLNAEGAIEHPPQALVEVLSLAARISSISEGAFDVTVQPLWRVYTHAQRDPGGFEQRLEEAASLIGWRRLSLEGGRVAFATPGMAATLNGIAQGYAADRIIARLRAAGFDHVLADLGEFRAVGERGPGQPWRIGIGRPDAGEVSTALSLTHAALATSSPSGFSFDATGERHHLFDARTGRSARSWAQVSVVAPDAATADALATAIAVAPIDAATAILAAGGGQEALLFDGGGRMQRLRA